MRQLTAFLFFSSFFYQRGTVWRSFSGGLPLLPATIFPSAFHSFCLSHFSINLHNLTLFIESGSCLLHRTNKMLPFSLPHNNLLFFFLFCSFASWRWCCSPGCWASRCLAGFSRHEAVCVRLKRGNLWRAGRALEIRQFGDNLLFFALSLLIYAFHLEGSSDGREAGRRRGLELRAWPISPHIQLACRLSQRWSTCLLSSHSGWICFSTQLILHFQF